VAGAAPAESFHTEATLDGHPLKLGVLRRG
jgi:hypothetical protein